MQMPPRLERRIGRFQKIADEMAAFAGRQEERAPGRMDHVVIPAREAADIAARVSAAYAAGDADGGNALVAQYSEHTMRHSFLPNF